MTSNEQNFTSILRQKCLEAPGSLALPESEDPRVISAASELLREKSFREIVLFGEKKTLLKRFEELGFSHLCQEKGITYASEAYPDLTAQVSHHLNSYHKERGKTVSENEIRKQSESALTQAGSLLYQSKTDVVIGGAVLTTAEVIRAAISTVGLKNGHRTVSGSFIFSRDQGTPLDLLLFADCGVVIKPKVHQLVDIASQSAETFSKITGLTPKVAFLSFSTKGSAQDESIDRMNEALSQFRERNPDVSADGEMQFDAAVDLGVAKRKLPSSPVGGKANVFIFPDLNSGNIGYKIAQRLGGYEAYGPILQGLSKPFSDLSRGTSAEEIKVSAYINYLRR